MVNCKNCNGTHGTHGMPPTTLLIILTNINSPKYSSKPIVRVIKKQYLCTQKSGQKKCSSADKIHRVRRRAKFLPPTRKNHPDWNDLQ